MVNWDIKSIEDKLKKSFSNIKGDMASLQESIENLKDSIEKKSEDDKERIERAEKEISEIRAKKDEKKDESENNEKLGLISKNISDLAEYISGMKVEISQLKKQKPAEKKDSEVKNIVEFSELRGEISELKYLIENIKIPPQKDYSEDISELRNDIEGLENNLSKLGKGIKSIRIPEQYDYSQDINQLARELGEIKGSQVNRKYIDKEISKINENISEKLSEIERKQEFLEVTIKDRARQPLVVSLKEEIKHLKAQIEEDKEKSEELSKEFSKENQKLRNKVEEQNLELKQEIINMKSKLTRLYSATPEERKKIVGEERIKEKTKENAHKIIKFLIILIPIILIGYIVYSNFLAAKDFNYFYDIGSEQDAKKPYLMPLNRVSDIENETNTLNYRNITLGLIYFDVPIPRGAESFNVEIKVSNPELNKILLGANDQNFWHYIYQSIYDPILENLGGFKFSDLGEYRIYQIKSDAEKISDLGSIPENSIISTDLNLVSPVKEQNYKLENLNINTSLRGAHKFYIYLKDYLDLKVKKQDINWYNGTDELVISLYNINKKLITNVTISDDGITKVNRSIAIIQSGELKVANLAEGVYILEFSDFDGLIREISLNTNKIITNKLFLADFNDYVEGIEKPSEIYFKTNRKSYINFATYHKSAFQDIKINEKNLSVNSTQKLSEFNADRGEYLIKSQKNDIILTSPGYLSFSKESYFEPFKYKIAPIPNDFEQLKSNYDYLITKYYPAENAGEWMTLTATFNLKDLYINNGKLSMLLYVPHLAEDKNETNTMYIPIDWINITVHKDGIFKKNGN